MNVVGYIVDIVLLILCFYLCRYAIELKLKHVLYHQKYGGNMRGHCIKDLWKHANLSKILIELILMVKIVVVDNNVAGKTDKVALTSWAYLVGARYV